MSVVALDWFFGGMLGLEIELELGFDLGTNLGKCSVVTGLRGWL